MTAAKFVADLEAKPGALRRRATIVGVGADVPGTAVNVRYTSDDDPDVALHAETLVGELVAASWWGRR